MYINSPHFIKKARWDMMNLVVTFYQAGKVGYDEFSGHDRYSVSPIDCSNTNWASSNSLIKSLTKKIPVSHRLGEDLKQGTLIIPIHQNPQFLTVLNLEVTQKIPSPGLQIPIISRRG